MLFFETMPLQRFGLAGLTIGTILSGRPVLAQSDALTRAPSRFAVLDGTRIHYKSLGTGRIGVVLVHGWASDHTVWRSQMPVLDGRARVVAVDLPGHGRSDKPNRAYSMEFFARAVNAVVEAAQVDHVVLVGHSMGTPITREFYRRYRTKVKGIVVVDGALKPPGLDSAAIERAVQSFAGPGRAAAFEQMIAPMFPGEGLAAVRGDIIRTANSTPVHVVTGSMRGMLDPSIWRDDPISVPVLAVMAKGPNWPPAYRTYVTQLVAQLDYQELEGVHHFLMLERPDLFNPLLTDFLKTLGVMQ